MEIGIPIGISRGSCYTQVIGSWLAKCKGKRHLMWTLPNLLSISRLPLALLCLYDNLPLRMTAIILAMVSDGLDGWIARTWGKTTSLGAALDPVMDKFFAGFLLVLFLSEGQISPMFALALLSRDIALLLFAGYLMIDRFLRGRAVYRPIRALWCGKAATFVQFMTFLLLLLYPIPLWLYGLAAMMGPCSLIELVWRERGRLRGEKTQNSGYYEARGSVSTLTGSGIVSGETRMGSTGGCAGS